jgi:thiamine kinase-like enzyme
MNKNININSYESTYDFSPVAWWLHLGTAVHGSILVWGGLSNDSIHYLSNLCDKLYLYKCLKYVQNEGADENIVVVDDKSMASNIYDSIVIDNYISGEQISADKLKDLFKKNLNNDGSICIYEENRYALIKESGLISKLLNLFTDKRLVDIQSSNKHAIVTKYPSISYSVNPYESFRDGAYVANKNIFTYKERFKQVLLRSRLSRLLATSNIWVIRKSKNHKNLIEIILSELHKKPYMKGFNDLDYSVIYYKFGKLIVSLKDKVNHDKSFFVVMALDQEAVKQRSNEKNTISHLRNNEEISKYIIDEYYEEDISGFKCYVMTEYQGVTVDIQTDKTEVMTNNAFNALMELTAATKNHDYDSVKTTALIESYFEIMSKRMPNHKNDILIIRNYVLREIVKHNISHVCMHGDLKLENFVLDNSNSVVGIIDWELSDLNGLPLIDLLYLIIYNHQIEYSLEFEDVFMGVFEGDIHSYETGMMNEYCNLLLINDELKELLIMVFFVHHFSFRFFIGIDSDTLMSFEKCLVNLLEIIKKREV